MRPLVFALLVAITVARQLGHPVKDRINTIGLIRRTSGKRPQPQSSSPAKRLKISLPIPPLNTMTASPRPITKLKSAQSNSGVMKLPIRRKIHPKALIEGTITGPATLDSVVDGKRQWTQHVKQGISMPVVAKGHTSVDMHVRNLNDNHKAGAVLTAGGGQAQATVITRTNTGGTLYGPKGGVRMQTVGPNSKIDAKGLTIGTGAQVTAGLYGSGSVSISCSTKLPSPNCKNP